MYLFTEIIKQNIIHMQNNAFYDLTLQRKKMTRSKIVDIIKKSTEIEKRNPALYRLNKKTDNLDQSELYRKMTFDNACVKISSLTKGGTLDRVTFLAGKESGRN